MNNYFERERERESESFRNSKDRGADKTYKTIFLVRFNKNNFFII